MGDIFDYIFLYLASMLLAVLKIAMLITWPWWVVALPTMIGLTLYIAVMIIGRD